MINRLPVPIESTICNLFAAWKPSPLHTKFSIMC